VKTAGRVITVILALLAFAAAAGGTAVALDVTQPSVKGASAVVEFQVKPGDSTAAVAARLQQAGLVRNAELFKLLARYRHLDTALEPGVYKLSASMTMDQIIRALLVGKPDEQLVTIPPGLRVTQYPKYITSLPNFQPDVFLKIAQTGMLPDGTKLSDQYWYVEPKGQNVAYALEGYLYPDTYYFATGDDAVAVVKRLLNALGEQLCPGPDEAHLDAYIGDQAACKSHAISISVGGKQVNIFDEMESRYFTKDDRLALYDALILGSFTIREIANESDAVGVADVYYNRYLTFKNNTNDPAGDVVNYLGSDPSAEYARDTDNPPKGADGNIWTGKWWADLGAAGSAVDPGNPYNTENADHKGLPPGPIAAPTLHDLEAAAMADDPQPSTLYYFFYGDCNGKVWYAKSFDEFARPGGVIAQAQAVKC
jgi:UPF0755 protein